VRVSRVGRTARIGNHRRIGTISSLRDGVPGLGREWVFAGNVPIVCRRMSGSCGVSRGAIRGSDLRQGCRVYGWRGKGGGRLRTGDDGIGRSSAVRKPTRIEFGCRARGLGRGRRKEHGSWWIVLCAGTFDGVWSGAALHAAGWDFCGDLSGTRVGWERNPVERTGPNLNEVVPARACVLPWAIIRR